ncbi:helix-turn-helix transcriptional regulator [Gordonibacter sp. An230]|uniref:helix-turn-helix transcriptional regulator n=1 Tax=Gordonibacter sp. An230 TaxID=1965592 RepID=UPI0013A61F7F|nr:helix-turn-helix transcriptional regulator [Gordonibacter sp. An230]
MGSFRLAKINHLNDGFALAGYALYSVYACLLFHSPTAISSLAPFGGVATFWFLIALLTGRVCGYVFYSLCPSRRVAPRHSQMALLAIFGLALLGFVVVGMALSFSPMVFDVVVALPWLCAGAFALGGADAALVVGLLGRLIAFDLRNSYLFLVVSNIVAVLAYYVLTFLPRFLSFPAAALFFFLALASLLCDQRVVTDRSKSEYSAFVFRGALFRLWRPILGVLTLGFMAGLILQISGREEIALEAFQQSSVFSSLLLYVVLLVVALALPKNIDLGRIYQVAIPISAVSFLLLPLVWNSAGGIVNSFANLGFMLALLVLTCLVVGLARDTGAPVFSLLGVAYATAYLSQWGGMIVGFCNASSIGRGTLALTAIALVSVYLLTVLSLALFKDKGFRGFEDDGAAPAEDRLRGVQVEGASCGERCDEIAEAYGFTEREREIVRYLGQGNTIHAVSKRLYISESTVKYHVKSIYQKLEIHTRQELIDMIAQRVEEPKG